MQKHRLLEQALPSLFPFSLPLPLPFLRLPHRLIYPVTRELHLSNKPKFEHLGQRRQGTGFVGKGCGCDETVWQLLQVL